MKAVKGNKVYTITEQEKKSYISRGFDILDDNGNTVADGSGKTVSYDEYAKIKAELEKLKSTAPGEEQGKEPEDEPEKEPEKPPKSPKKEEK